MKLYIITGEPSGDLHAANIVKEIKKKDNISIRAWGGDKLMEEGVDIARSINKTSFMGFLDVILNIRQVYDNINFCKKDIINYNPDLVLLVDYPGFNLKIAKFCKKNNIKVMYYIAPKVWAWNSGRINKIRKYVDKLLVIFPFEVKFFKDHNIIAEYVGNPILNNLLNRNSNVNLNYKNKVIALLPGSRKQEIDKILPKMISVSQEFINYQFVIAAVNNFNITYYKKFISPGINNIDIVYNQTYDLLEISSAALVTSGTATLEAAILKVPQVVCYKTDLISYYLIKFFIRIKFISLVNILLNKEVVKELIQYDLNKNNLISSLNNILDDKTRDEMINQYDYIVDQLAEKDSTINIVDFICK